MSLFGMFIKNQMVKIYRTCLFPFRKLLLMCTKKVMFGIKGYADKATSFEGNNYIGQEAFVCASTLGKGTYIGDGSRICNLNAGRFCSIGFNVSTAIGTHPVRDNISTSPSMYSLNPANNLSYADSQYFDDATGPVTMGNDVWVGNNAVLLGGITIGDGAVIGAGSVVTKSVEPYCIYAGVPAKQIGKRFDDDMIKKLTELKWWEKDDSWLGQNAKSFSEPDKFMR